MLALVQEAQSPARAASPALQSLCLTPGLCLFLSWAQYLALLIRMMRRPPDMTPGRLAGPLANAIAGPRAQRSPGVPSPGAPSP